MASATCLLSSIRCSTNDHPISSKVGDLKSELSSIVKPSIQTPENSTLRTEACKTIKTVSSAMLNSLVDSIFQFVDQPMLPSEKTFAPVEEIGELVKVDYCQGKIPEDFPEGIYVRNGANPLFGGLKTALSVFGKTDSIWVEGEGMLHALHFTKDAQGNWSFYYKNRYVETDTYKMESQRKMLGPKL